MLSLQRRQVACQRASTTVCQAQRGFGRGKRATPKKGKSTPTPTTVNSEAQQLLGEYSAVKQSTPTMTSSHAAPTARAKAPTTEAPAAAAAPSSSVAPSSSSSTTASKASATKSKAAAKPPPAEPPAPAASSPAAAPATSSSSSSSSSAGGSSTAAAAGTTPAAEMPLAPPLPESFKAAGTRITAFESKLVSKPPSPPPGAAGELPPEMEGASCDLGLQQMLPSTIARLAAAFYDLEAAENHVQGLAGLLADAQSTLASLKGDEAEASSITNSVSAAVAADSAAAAQLVGLMSDVLSDITGEMGLVCGQLDAARGDIDASVQALEQEMRDLAAAETAEAAVLANNRAQLAAAKAVAAVAAAAAAAEEAQRKGAVEASLTEAAKATELAAQATEAARAAEEQAKDANAAKAAAEEARAAAEKQAKAEAAKRAAAEAEIAAAEAKRAAAEKEIAAEAAKAVAAAKAAEEAKAAEAAAAEAAAAAERVAAEAQQALTLRDAELAVLARRNEQLAAQLALLTAGEPGGAVEGGGSLVEADPRVRALLASQVSSNMALLDWLACLAKSVVGLEGVAPGDKLALAGTISKCVAAVGGGGGGGGGAASNGSGSSQGEAVTAAAAAAVAGGEQA